MPTRASTDTAPPTNNGTPPPGKTVPELPTITPAPRLRRRPKIIALGVALIALGGALSAYIWTANSDAVSVVAISRSVQRGQTITDADLSTATITPDPALHTVPSSQRSTILGKRASTDLAAGSILTPTATTTDLIPPAGRSLVGVAVTAAQLPASPLVAGDTVRIIDTPRKQDDPPTGTPNSVAATVVRIGATPDANGVSLVDVTVPTTDAAALAAHIATGRIAIVLDSGEH